MHSFKSQFSRPDSAVGYDTLVVGAGFAGSVIAERLASQAGQRVLVVDKRPHIGGNAHDRYDANGLLIHPYGPHIFHTNSAEVFGYLSQFTEWRPYQHRVLASVDGQLLPMHSRAWGTEAAKARIRSGGTPPSSAPPTTRVGPLQPASAPRRSASRTAAQAWA